MEIVQYILNFFFPGSDVSWFWNYLLLLLLLVCYKNAGKTDKYFNIK